MHTRRHAASVALGIGLLLVPVLMAAPSRSLVPAFERKLDDISKRGPRAPGGPAVRTIVSQDEVNSWLLYGSPAEVPEGVAEPQLTFEGQDRVTGRAVVDLDAVSRSRSSGGLFDPWSLVGGRLPVTTSGVLRTGGGQARFEVERADIAGIPVPASMLFEIVAFYTRSPENPGGTQLGRPFDLPSSIERIQIERARAIVVQ
ncbi:MAG: hypothetical protein HOP14_05140 [Acidobacteria bacterium]|nr:hypothetical protein [Acidobacteriota bacterium]